MSWLSDIFYKAPIISRALTPTPDAVLTEVCKQIENILPPDKGNSFVISSIAQSKCNIAHNDCYIVDVIFEEIVDPSVLTTDYGIYTNTVFGVPVQFMVNGIDFNEFVRSVNPDDESLLLSGFFTAYLPFNSDISKWDVNQVTNVSGFFMCDQKEDVNDSI